MNRVESSPENCGSRINRDQAEELSRAARREFRKQIFQKILVVLVILGRPLQLKIGIYSCRYLITLSGQIPIIA